MRKITAFCVRVSCLLYFFATASAYGQSNAPAKSDSVKFVAPVYPSPYLQFAPTQGLVLHDPANVQHTVTFDPVSRKYVLRKTIGNHLYGLPQYLTIDEYRDYEYQLSKQKYWKAISDSLTALNHSPGFIPAITINSQTFEKIFGGSNIDIRPQGSADLTLSGRINKNENPLFNERQRTQANFDFDQSIKMNVIGQIGDKMRLNFNYNTDAEFDFENQMKLDYTGKSDEIIRKIEAGNVSLPLPTTLITGTQALFGLKAQFQFGRLGITTVASQQKSQAKVINIANGSQQNEFSISADSYEANRHYFLATYFRNNYNKAMASLPTINSNITITKIEVWVTNKSSSTTDSRDVLALLDLGENKPFNTAQVQGGAGFSGLPAAFNGPGFTQQSNNLLQNLPATTRATNSNDINTYFQANGGTDNYVKLTYAQKLTPNEFKLNARLGYISLGRALNADEVLAVAYRYTVNGTEYQVGEFSTDINVDPVNPQVLYVKLLKNETLKTNLPTWDLMMKNIYQLGATQVSRSGFNLNIFRLDDNSGIEKPLITEGTTTNGKLWLQVTGVDRLNQQNDRSPDGYFDYIDPGTIDAVNGVIMFPQLEPFGADLAAQFNPVSEQALINKYVFQPLYDSTRVSAQQGFSNLNRYVIRGTYQSEISNEFSLNSINVPAGSVQVSAGAIPLIEGQDFTVDYNQGRVKILNTALLNSGQAIRINLENSEAFGQQQRSMVANRLDYHVSDKFHLGATFMNLTEKPLTAKVNLGEEAISNTIFGVDANYSSASRWLTRMVDKLPFIDTKEPSSVTFAGEYAKLVPGHPKALNFAGSSNGASYIDDFEGSRSIIDLKSPVSWQISSTPRMFSESQLNNDLAYGYNRAQLAFYTIDPIFFRSSSLTPANIKNNRGELSNPYTREVLEQEVFPYKQSTTGQPLTLPTFDLALYPNTRGPYNYTTSGLNADGTLTNPRNRWAGIFRKIETPDFESLNIETVEIWLEDPFINKPNSQGGDFYINLGSIPEDINKDGRKSLENGLPPDGSTTGTDQTVWGRVPKLQPVIQAFDNNPQARKFQDVGLDGLSDPDEQSQYAPFLNQVRGQLSAAAFSKIQADPSSDDYQYYRGDNLDNQNAGVLKRYEHYNGTEGNSKTTEQSKAETGIDNSAATSLPDGEDINRDNNSSLADEYFQYKISLRPQDMVVGQNFITDKVTPTVKLPNGTTQQTTWYQFRIPITQYQQKVGNIQDFKSIRFIRMFLTNFQDTINLRMARLQLLRGEWRRYNAENSISKVLSDPALGINPGPDGSTLDVGTINIEENGTRTPIPYVVPPGIERERDISNFRGDTRQNEQSLTVDVANLKDGFARAAFKTSPNDFRSYRRLEMFIHAEGSQLRDNDLSAFIRVGTDNQDNYYEYSIPLKVTNPGSRDPEAIWPEVNRLNVELKLFQDAKTARNAAIPGGVSVNQPFVYKDGNNTIIVKGQPDLSKIRVFMLGIRNPLKTAANPLNDDGLSKTAQVWFNELRLTDFDERGGWAATARLNAKLADFADFTVSGSNSTVGFGSIEKRVGERNRTDDKALDISSSIEAGRFFPARTGIQIPVYINYSSQVSLPQYDPRTPDIELQRALKQLSKAAADSIRFNAEDRSTRRSINFTNVRKLKTDTATTTHLWDIENWSATYAYNEYNHHDFINQLTVQKTYRAAIDYSFSTLPKVYMPFQKLVKSPKLALLRDFNFSLMPSSLSFNLNVDRLYSENTLRNNDANTFVPINTSFNKNYLLTRVYGATWNLTQLLKLDFSATNLSVIDEPDGRITNHVRDSIWNNLKRLGRNTNYNHSIELGYTTPINKIPGLGFANLTVGYGSTFSWRTEPLVTLRDPAIDFGNTIENTRELQFSPSMNFDRIPFIHRINSNTEGGTLNSLLKVVTSLRRVTGSLQRKQGTFLPGYQPGTNVLGYDFDANAPGWNFVLGGQQDIRQKAIEQGWLTRDTLQNQLYVNTSREDLRLQGSMEPAPGLTIDLTAVRSKSVNYSTNFRFDNTVNGFRNLSPVTTGDYSISFFSLKTAFGKGNETRLFRKFEENRAVISQRLGAGNPNSAGAAAGFADGYGKGSQDVIVNAFLSAYTGTDPGKSKLKTFPSIPVPNWRIRYTGLTKYDFFNRIFASFSLNHEYKSVYAVNSFNSLIRYQEANGAVNVRDVNTNFLPRYQFGQVAITEQFLPLIGADMQLKNNMTANIEYRTSRTLVMGLANSQLAYQRTANMTFVMGYLTNNFRFPFGLFNGRKLNNNLHFQLESAIQDNKVLIFRADVADPEVSSGAKNITYSPSIDYTLNQLFNMKLFYDGNITKPYTSQTFNTSFSNFGVSMRFTLQ